MLNIFLLFFYTNINQPSSILKRFSFLFVFLWFILIFYLGYITGKSWFYHDSIVPQTYFHIFYDSIIQGRLPLWSPEMNNGQPIWLSLELYPILDPVALIIYPFSYLYNIPSNFAYQLCVFIWIFAFAFGGFLYSKKITQNWWLSLLTFIILFGGPIAVSAPGQSLGFVLPFRYFTLTIYSLILLADSPSNKKLLLFISMLAISTSGYQTGYNFLLIILFYTIFCISKTRTILRALSIPYFILALTLLLFYLFPTIISFTYWKNDLIAVGRSIENGWLLDWRWPYDYIMIFSRLNFGWHGSTYIGLPFVSICILFIILFIWRIIKNKRELQTFFKNNYQTILFLTLCVIITTIPIGLPKVIGLRNWGFCTTVLIFAIVIFNNNILQVIGGYFSKNRINIFYFSFTIMTFIDMSFFVSRHKYSLFEKYTHKPLIWKKKSIMPTTKVARYEPNDEIKNMDPFFFESPVIKKKYVFSTNFERLSLPGNSPSFPMTLISTYQFSLKSYSEFINLNPKIINNFICPPLVFTTKLIQNSEIPNFKNSAISTSNLQIKSYTPEKIIVSVSTPENTNLIMIDNYTSDWKFMIDNNQIFISNINPLLKAIPITKGRHKVVISYQPRLYIFGFWLRVISTFFIIIFFAFIFLNYLAKKCKLF